MLLIYTSRINCSPKLKTKVVDKWVASNVALFVSLFCGLTSQSITKVLSGRSVNLTACFQDRLLFENTVALNPGLGGVSDVVFAIISHEQNQSNRTCCFQTLDAVFPKDLVFIAFNLYLVHLLSPVTVNCPTNFYA